VWSFVRDLVKSVDLGVAIPLASLIVTLATVFYAARQLKHAKASEERVRVSGVLAEIVTAAQEVVTHIEARPRLHGLDGEAYLREERLAEDSFRTFRNLAMRYRLMRGNLAEVDFWVLDVANNLINTYLAKVPDEVNAPWSSREVVDHLESDLDRPEDAPAGLPPLGQWWKARSACASGVYDARTAWEFQIGRLLHDYIEDYLVPYGRWVLHGVEPEMPVHPRSELTAPAAAS
jgi:hypothetical protein